MGEKDSLCVTTGDTSQLDESSADYVWFQIRRRTAFLSFSLCKRTLFKTRIGTSSAYYEQSMLSCLVPIELKIGKFKPEHIGQINFYLEALDRTVKKPNENPSVGVVLCASKDDAVVEYALSRSMSPTLVSDYKLCLPDKEALQAKLREVTDIALEQADK